MVGVQNVRTDKLLWGVSVGVKGQEDRTESFGSPTANGRAARGKEGGVGPTYTHRWSHGHMAILGVGASPCQLRSSSFCSVLETYSFFRHNSDFHSPN